MKTGKLVFKMPRKQLNMQLKVRKLHGFLASCSTGSTFFETGFFTVRRGIGKLIVSRSAMTLKLGSVYCPYSSTQ